MASHEVLPEVPRHELHAVPHTGAQQNTDEGFPLLVTVATVRLLHPSRELPEVDGAWFDAHSRAHADAPLPCVAPSLLRYGILFLAQSHANTIGGLDDARVYSNLNTVPLSDTVSRMVVESVTELSVWVIDSMKALFSVSL